LKDLAFSFGVSWLFELHRTQPIAHAIGVLAFVCVIGMALGSLKFRGIGLGTAAVLFAGIVVGHFGNPVDHHTLDFVKELGLILFVFTIGLQLGPGFLAALRHQGVKLNVLAASVVIFGAMLAPFLGWLAGFDNAAVLGIFSGASTNTPSLGAASQTLSTLPDISADRLALPALAYAVSYPTAIVGIIGTLLLLKQIFASIRLARQPHSRQRIVRQLKRSSDVRLSLRIQILMAFGSTPFRVALSLA
jgi:putative transport protein